MTDTQIADFTSQVKEVVELYKLDGINLWDEGSGYGKEGMPPMNTTSYPKLIKSLREAMPDKLLTLVDKEEPTEYFHDVTLCGGIEVGKYIDYAWHGYFLTMRLPKLSSLGKPNPPTAITKESQSQVLPLKNMEA